MVMADVSGKGVPAMLNADANATTEKIPRQVRSAVDGFVKDAKQFDDLTMLCLEYIGDDESKQSETLRA